MLFRKQDYFKEKAGITEFDTPKLIKHKAALSLTFQPFPITKWAESDVTEDHIFDVIEFLYDHVSKPGVMQQMTTDMGWNYNDYDGYDKKAGQEEFKDTVNAFLHEYKTGFELTQEGIVLALGTERLQHILGAEIPEYDEVNVDSKVRNAITKWRNRNLSLAEKKNAIRDLADVFEWLKKSKRLEDVLDKKDDSAIFDIANNFEIRHHDPKQKTNYDRAIWYSWIFHFYLATYHAVIRLLIQRDKEKKYAGKV